jgi:adenylate cyclase
MLYYQEPGAGVLASLEMLEGISSAGLPPVHIGLAAGPVLFQDGDYYGRTVNLASRIADYAGPGEVVVSQSVIDAPSSGPVSFTEIGPAELKGISGAIRLFKVRRG